MRSFIKKRRVGLHAKRSRNCLQPGSTARNLCQGNDYFDEKIFRQREVKRTGRAGGGRRGQRNKQRLGGIWWVGHNLGNWEGALGYLMLAELMDMEINNTFFNILYNFFSLLLNPARSILFHCVSASSSSSR